MRRCEITDAYAREIHRYVQRKHGSRKRHMTVEAKDEYNSIVRHLDKRLRKVCKRYP